MAEGTILRSEKQNKRQYLDQRNRIIDPRKYTQPSRKGGKAIHWGC